MSYKKSTVTTEMILKCSECGMEIYKCDSCNCYFEIEDVVFCNEEHLCKECHGER